MEFPSQNESSCLRVFDIPELAGIICGLARKRDNVNLLRVCRRLFYDVCPFVWENTDAVVTIVSMIPGGGIAFIGDDILPPLAVMKLPSALDLSRLQVYAPYVKNLEVPLQSLESLVDRYDNWDGFLTATRSTTLLPNLEHICLSPDTFDAVMIPEEIVNWVTAFLSTSLLSLSVASRAPLVNVSTPKYIFVDFELAHRLLDDISKKCPRIDSLELFIGRAVLQSEGFPRGRPELTNANFCGPSPDIPPILSRLQNLRTLTTTPFCLFNGALRLLAELPLLESLTVHNLRSNTLVYGQDLLPDNSFPSLQHLEFRSISRGTIHNLCRQPSICKGLRSLRIHGFRPYRWSSLEPPHFLSEIISSLADHQAPITTLSLTGATRQLIGAQMVKALKHLPLTNLSWSFFDLDLSHLESMLGALQFLEELKMYTHSGFQLPQLRLIITSLPRLRNLSLHMDSHALNDLRMDEIVPSRTQSQDRFCLASDIHLPEPQRESAEKIARYLYALKPNMRYALFGANVYFSAGNRGESPALINEALSRLREASH